MKKEKFYKHYCDACVYHGSVNSDNKNYDVYTCKSLFDTRTLLLRFGNNDYEYISSALFLGYEFSELDMIAIIGGLELTEKEKEAFNRVLLRRFKSSLTMQDYVKFGIFNFTDSSILDTADKD